MGGWACSGHLSGVSRIRFKTGSSGEYQQLGSNGCALHVQTAESAEILFDASAEVGVLSEQAFDHHSYSKDSSEVVFPTEKMGVDEDDGGYEGEVFEHEPPDVDAIDRDGATVQL